VQHHAANQLDVEMALAEGALGRLAHRGERRNQDVECFAVGELLAVVRAFSASSDNAASSGSIALMALTRD
jgi:hypothetical protein